MCTAIVFSVGLAHQFVYDPNRLIQPALIAAEPLKLDARIPIAAVEKGRLTNRTVFLYCGRNE